MSRFKASVTGSISKLGGLSEVRLLPSTSVHAPTELAEAVRDTVERRLEFTDHRAGRHVSLTVSAAVADAMALTGGVADPERVMAELEVTLRRAKLQGRNRVERGRRPANAERPATSI